MFDTPLELFVVESGASEAPTRQFIGEFSPEKHQAFQLSSYKGGCSIRSSIVALERMGCNDAANLVVS
jgi:hypothetical protein